MPLNPTSLESFFSTAAAISPVGIIHDDEYHQSIKEAVKASHDRAQRTAERRKRILRRLDKILHSDSPSKFALKNTSQGVVTVYAHSTYRMNALPFPLVHPCLGLCGVIFPVVGEWRDTVHIAGTACAGLPAQAIVPAEPSASARKSASPFIMVSSIKVGIG